MYIRSFNGLGGTRRHGGLGFFGKSWGPPSPPPTPTGLTFDQKMQLQKMQQDHEMEMMKLRLQLQQAGASPQAVKEVTTQAQSTAASAVASGDIAALKAELDALKRAQDVAKQGGSVEGTEKSVKELLAPGAKQVAFMRSTNKPDANIPWNSWERMKALLPANFNEEKYLANNPDVAQAVKSGAMPSGAYHFVMYGMGPGCHVSSNPSGKGHCDASPRSFAGLRGGRRPGYLSGIFANWDQGDW